MGEKMNSIEITSSQEALLSPPGNFDFAWDQCVIPYVLSSNIEQKDENVPSVSQVQDVNSNEMQIVDSNPIYSVDENIASVSGLQNINLNQMFGEHGKLPSFSEIQNRDPMLWRAAEDELSAFMIIQNEEDSMKWRSQMELESPGLSETSTNQNTLIHEGIFQEEKHIQPQLIPSSMAHQATASQVQISSQCQVSSSASRARSSLPAIKSWPGEYDFSVSFSHQEKSTKGVAWVYSSVKDKLYVRKDAACPINFSTNSILPNDVCVRVMALYTSPEQVSEIVHRCVFHSMDELNKGLTEAEHLIRCESSAASYNVDSITGRHSVVVPFENPPAGQQYSTCIYKFACFGSCSGGPNRRPLMLIFTLEKDNEVIGRRKLDVKICACPGRDIKIEESQVEIPQSRNSQPVKRKEPESVNLYDVMNFTKHIQLPPLKKTKTTTNKEGVYTVHVKDKACYEFLSQMKHFYDICHMLQRASSDVTKTLLYYLKKKNEEKE